MLTFRADPNVSEEAKQHAREVLKNEGVGTGDDSDDLHKTRVNAGYKAALHSTWILLSVSLLIAVLNLSAPQTRMCPRRPRSTLARFSRAKASSKQPPALPSVLHPCAVRLPERNGTHGLLLSCWILYDYVYLAQPPNSVRVCAIMESRSC